MPDVRSRHSRVAGLARRRKPHDPELEEARRDLKAALLEEHVRGIVDTFPPLTPEQRDRLAGLLRGSRTPDDSAGAA